MNVGRGYVMNDGRGYVITRVGIELLGQLKSFDGKHGHGIPLNMKCVKNRRSLLLVKTLQKVKTF